MRAILASLPLLLASCGSLVTQNDIFEQSRVELARREPWADQATILIQEHPDAWQMTWKVSAGSFDYSQRPGAQGLRVVPGTERELRFTRDGCLIAYANPTSRCLTPVVRTGTPAAPWSTPDK